MSIRGKLDILIKDTDSYNKELIPNEIFINLKKWKWGKYGWVSPASLIFTASWRKYYYPDKDCCKIWAVDEKNVSIDGGYSIRSEDEKVSIPLLAKYDLCKGFCSPNSGMQGSRALEKMRYLKRINKNISTSTKTVFDLGLFAEILNQINELNEEESLEVIKYLIVTAKDIKSKRIKSDSELKETKDVNIDILDFLSKTRDPELTKCIVATCLDIIFNNHGLILEGVSDYKTAADARSKKPGDLLLTRDNNPIIAVEVKDKTQTIDWNNIERAIRIIDANPTLINFIFVLENRQASSNSIVQEMVSSSQLSSGRGAKISIFSLHDLYLLALSISDELSITNITSENLTIAPNIKPETKEKWLQTLRKANIPEKIF